MTPGAWVLVVWLGAGPFNHGARVGDVAGLYATQAVCMGHVRRLVKADVLYTRLMTCRYDPTAPPLGNVCQPSWGADAPLPPCIQSSYIPSTATPRHGV